MSMPKFDELVGRPWNQLTLYAESIPHLLHWDLAYLWMLEKSQAVRPDRWKERVEAWRYLVSLLLMDQLEIKTDPIEEPLIDYTQPFGLTSVSWVKLKNLKGAIGVFSPTVLIRPLPDYKRTYLEHWKTVAADPQAESPQELAALIELAVQELGRQRTDSFAHRLSLCMRKEFNSGVAAAPTNARAEDFHFLNRLSWSPTRQATGLTKVRLFLRTQGDGGRLWVPRCERCNALLTRNQADPPIVVETDNVDVPCSVCGSGNVVSSSSFLLWIQTGQQVILWKREGVTSAPRQGFPPIPKNNGSELEFEWDPGRLGGEVAKRFIRFKFPGRTVEERSVKDLTYPDILVPGELSSQFKGLPFRNEWLHAISNITEISADIDVGLRQIVYQNVRVRGLPVELTIRFGSLSVRNDPNVCVGLYPNPRLMPNSWSVYRVFLAGNDRRKYSLHAEGAHTILPWIAQFNDGVPQTFCMETEQGRIGACFLQGFAESVNQNPIASINVGVDFGTSNTLIYVAPQNANASNIVPDQFAIRPSDLIQNVLWITGNAPKDGMSGLGDFLPPTTYGSRVDPYLIPTAVWEVGTNVFIRWNSVAPVDNANQRANFKSEQQAAPLRLAYLRELMFLTMPSMITKTGLAGAKIKLNIGFAFPMAFGFGAREEMGRLLSLLRTELEVMGCQADCFSINESQACVRAFGAPRLNDNFLVADMGGGTLDLALFTTCEDQQVSMHQIGSLRYAGEQYLEAFATRGQLQTGIGIWQIRDAISNGESSRLYGRDPEAQKILDRFVGFAFEYLRTMLLAFKQDRSESVIRLVLVGNGWHLIDAFSPEIDQRGPQKVFEESYKDLVNRLSVSGVELYLSDPLPRLPSSKHLVVIGALQNAWDGQGERELNSADPSLSKLPSGRGMELGRSDNQKRFAWFEVLGDGIPLVGFSPSDLKVDSVFYLDEAPPLEEQWRRHLLKLFSCRSVGEIDHPEEMQLRAEIYRCIQGNPAKVGKGPLQIILEQSWTNALVK